MHEDEELDDPGSTEGATVFLAFLAGTADSGTPSTVDLHIEEWCCSSGPWRFWCGARLRGPVLVVGLLAWLWCCCSWCWASWRARWCPWRAWCSSTRVSILQLIYSACGAVLQLPVGRIPVKYPGVVVYYVFGMYVVTVAASF